MLDPPPKNYNADSNCYRNAEEIPMKKNLRRFTPARPADAATARHAQ